MKKIYIMLFVIAGVLVGCGDETSADSLTSEKNIVISETESGVADMSNEIAAEEEMSTVEEPVVEENSAEISERIPGEEGAPIIWDAWAFTDAINVGWNLGDALGSSAKDCGYDANPDLERKWGNPAVTQELIDYVASLGFNTIRIPVSWCYNCGRGEDGTLLIGEQWLNRVHEVVDYAVQNDMYIIINTMCDSWELFRCGVEDETEWQQVQQDAESLWRQIAESFAEYDERLVFESYNELDNMVTGFTYSDLSVEQMNTLNGIFVTTVRETGGNNRERILMVPTLFNSTRTNIMDAFQLPDDVISDRIVVTVHCYESEFDQDIEWKFETIEAFSQRVNAPVIIGEFGARDDYTLIEWREEFTSNYIARAAEHGIKCCIWDDGYHWKLIDRYDFTQTDMDMIQAIFDGVEGKAYRVEESAKLVLDNTNDFYFGAMNWETGTMQMVDYENKYWATLTTKTEDNRFHELRDGDYICVSMTTRGPAVNFWIYCLYFLDENQNRIAHKVGKNIAHRFLCAEIPEGARYFLVNTYDPYDNHKLDQIQQYMEQGDLKMTITLINTKDQDFLKQECLKLP